jgi:hypothetical protein
MELMAHITSLEATTGIVMFLAGSCVGALMARFFVAWSKEA